jgi:hypothetical protein
MKKVSVGIVLVLAAAVSASAQTKYKAPRTESGQPDLQGTWNFSSDVPMQRPKAFADRKVMTREEREKQNLARENSLQTLGKQAPVEIADPLWLDYAARIEDLRTSLITYPENGRLPALVDGIQPVGGFAVILNPALGGTRPVRFTFGGIGISAPEDRGTAERCIASANTTPPFTPDFDSNYVQIVQSRDHVVLRADGIGAVRIVPLSTRPLPGTMRSWAGYSTGRWEGDTLVVETKNFNGLTQSFAEYGTSYEKVVTERFTRVADDRLEYEATVEDPKTFKDKFVFSFPMAKVDAAIFEEACHEGNYSMRLMLEGARKEEQESKK